MGRPRRTAESQAPGGAAILEKYGRAYFQAMGRKGGRMMSETHDVTFYRGIGHKGGNRVLELYGREYYAALGRLSQEKRRSKANHLAAPE